MLNFAILAVRAIAALTIAGMLIAFALSYFDCLVA